MCAGVSIDRLAQAQHCAPITLVRSFFDVDSQRKRALVCASLPHPGGRGGGDGQHWLLHTEATVAGVTWLIMGTYRQNHSQSYKLIRVQEHI